MTGGWWSKPLIYHLKKLLIYTFRPDYLKTGVFICNLLRYKGNRLTCPSFFFWILLFLVLIPLCQSPVRPRTIRAETLEILWNLTSALQLLLPIGSLRFTFIGRRVIENKLKILPFLIFYNSVLTFAIIKKISFDKWKPTWENFLVMSH
jgi:hypothetical protein